MMEKEPLIDVRNLSKHFPVFHGMIFKRKIAELKALDNISFRIFPGETLGLVGESGCGKTTACRVLLQLEIPTAGEIRFQGKNITGLDKRALRKLRNRMQIIFQDPFSALNPRMKIGDIVGEPLHIHGLARGKTEYNARVAEILETVGLHASMADRYPHEFSGGQRQRIGIARALILNPAFLVCDEPVSALDVSIQAQIINLLAELQAKRGLTYLFIAHDLAVVRHISNRVAVMYLGEIVEIAGRDELYHLPLHPYTKALLAAVPIPDPEIEKSREHCMITGEVPSLFDAPEGCKFHPRCPMAQDICRGSRPVLKEINGNGHEVACHLVDN
ncbi:MAG: ATP-binding cassette domain-containing protein [Desulfobacterales bacterium]|jgi:oligopeptide transport system ATP-binding protein|nr:ATP-binding cassette domain-containing protein [Desulfobacterales bacterium]